MRAALPSVQAPQPINPTQVRRQILTLAFPVVAEQVLNTLTNVADMMMVGHLGPAAIAAVGLSNQPLFLSMAIFMGIGTGTTALVARYTGAGEPGTVESVTRQSFWMGLASAILVAMAYYAFAPAIVGSMGAEADVLPLGIAFLRWSAPGFVAMKWSQVMSGALRGRGDTRTPLQIGILVNLLNLILGYSLIYGHLGLPALGVVGSALGTTIARGVGALILLGYLLRSTHPVRLHPPTLFQLDLGVMARVLRIGLPTAGERVIQTMGMIFFMRIIAGLGTVSVATHQLALNAESISYMPALGLATAGTALVGQRIGARDPEGAQQVVRETVRITVMVMTGMSLVFLFLGRPYLSLYTSEEPVIGLGARMLAIGAAAQIPMGLTFALGGALRGAGDTLPMMIATAFGVWVVRLGITTGLIHLAGWGLAAAWSALVFDWTLRSAFAFLRIRSGRWREIQV
ncbi:MAG: MATE family efflux transporter [Bacillota bacterium]